MSGPVRVRFAPSPTGFLHIGGARTALFNWLFARSRGGVFVLRIEDTDRDRSRWDAVEQILDSMTWLGLAWDEGPLVGGPHGPYFQTARLDRYRAAAGRLVAAGRAYPCFCRPEALEAEREAARRDGRAWRYPGRCRDLAPAERAARLGAGLPSVLRFLLPAGSTVFRDELHGDITFQNGELDDFILVKTDGFPTYNFAVVVDDLDMRISHVIRGDDHLSNTHRQALLYRALDAPLPVFLHVPQILGSDKSRLSKRHGATSVAEYRDAGILPEALMGYLARLGWSLDDRTELFTPRDLVEFFRLERIGKTPAVFDLEKLRWVNGRYLKALPPAERARALAPALLREGLLPPAPAEADWRRLAEVLSALGERAQPGPDLARLVEPFYRDPERWDEATTAKLLGRPEAAGLLAELASRLEALDAYDAATVEGAIRELAAARGVAPKEIIHPARYAVTAHTVGAGLFETLALAGREATVRRLRRAAALAAPVR